MAEEADNDEVSWDPAVLRAERDARGWSIAEAARQLRSSADLSLPGHDSLVKAWKRWERGTEPGRFYGPLLANLLAGPDPTQRCGITTAFPRRTLVPVALWDELLRGAQRDVWMLQHGGLFLAEQQPELLDLLAVAADAGARVRLLFAEPECLAVTIRAEEEAVGSRSLAAQIHHTLALHQPLAEHPNVEVRVHTTTLHASIFRFDDHMLVAQQVYGLPAAQAPVLRLRPGDLFDTYARCFNQIWLKSAPAWPDMQAAETWRRTG